MQAPIPWMPEMQTAFDKMHALAVADTLAAYPDHNKRFDVYTDASDFQLGACIVQEGCPVAYFPVNCQNHIRIMGLWKKCYPLSLLDKFQGMLLGSDVHVFTDHKNLTFDTLKMQGVLRWCYKVKEFSPTLHYIEGPCNILADNLSWLNCLITPAQIAEGKHLVEPTVVSDDEDDIYFLTQEYSGYHEDDLTGVIECYLNLPEIPHPDCNPLDYVHIWELQQQDMKLLSLCTKYPDNYIKLKLDNGVYTSSAIKQIPLKTIGKLLYLKRWCLAQSSGSTKSWVTRGKIGISMHCPIMVWKCTFLTCHSLCSSSLSTPITINNLIIASR